MQQRERGAELVGYRAHVLPWQRRELPEISAVEELEGIVRLFVVHTVVDCPHDTRVTQFGKRVELSLEELRAARDLFAVALDREEFESDLGP
jgi:hypothetical protein